MEPGRKSKEMDKIPIVTNKRSLHSKKQKKKSHLRFVVASFAISRCPNQGPFLIPRKLPKGKMMQY